MATWPSRTEAELLSFAANFSTMIGDAPADYGLSEAQATEYATVYTRFSTLYDKAQQPTMRTPAIMEGKGTAKRDLVALTRKYAKIITGQPTTTDEMLVSLGLPVRDLSPTPILPPTQSPKIQVVSVSGWTVKVKLTDDTGPRLRPVGVKGANLFSYVGETPPNELSAWKYEAGITRSTATLEFDHALPPGTKIFLTAFWFNPRLQSGPACPPVSTQINYGGLAVAA